MNHRINFRVITYLCIFTAIVTFPFCLLAGEKEEAIKHEAGFYYTIQKGDTLWDLSERFFDSPWQWPDLWNENHQIQNPHWIYPGERIRLHRREGVESFTEKSEEKKVLQIKETPYYFYSSIDRVGFIRKEPVTPSGFILKVKGDKNMICKGDLVYIKQQENIPLTPGSKYTVYKTLKPIKDDKTKSIIGIQHYLTGIVEITKNKSGFAEGRVVQSFRSIEANDLLMPYKRRSPKITLKESKKGLTGKIIISEEHRSIIGDNTIAFIDKGENDGVTSGQIYNIYYHEKEVPGPKTREEVLFTPVDFGTVLVLHTEQTTSTVLVTGSDKDISPGEKIRTPLR